MGEEFPDTVPLLQGPMAAQPSIEVRAAEASAEAGDDAPPTSYVSRPSPPRLLWDKTDVQFLDLVRCHATIWIVSLDPKAGTYSARMKCYWAFRTLNSNQESELRLLGVPGIRMPANTVTVDESRIWKDITVGEGPNARTTLKTVFWRGTSTFTISGFKIFQMENFPYDRQVVNLEQFEFVWRPHKDEADYYRSMKVVSFKVKTESLLPEWSVEKAYITPVPKCETKPADPNGPSYAHRFVVRLRIERREAFYVRQIFFVTSLMVIAACAPLAMPPSEDAMGTRLEVYGSSLLTLVAFKYAVADHLPSVPYSTFADNFLLAPIICVCVCIIETVIVFHMMSGIGTDDDGTESLRKRIDTAENIAFYCLFFVWSMYFAYAACYKPKYRTAWPDVVALKSQNSWVKRKIEEIGFFEKEGDPEELEELEEDAASPGDRTPWAGAHG